MSAKKALQLSWCLAEARADEVREYLHQAETVALQQDARGNLLILRFTTCSRDMLFNSAILGAAVVFGTTSAHVLKASLGVIDAACEPRRLPPFRKTLTKVDMRLRDHVLKRTELFAADGDKAEQKVGNMLRGCSMSSNAKAMCPNLRCIVKDRAHTSTKLTKLGWNTDLYLKTTLELYVVGRDSFANLVAHSTVFRKVFNARARAQTVSPVDGQRMTDLQYATQRFSSSQKPLGRVVLFWDASLSTSYEIIVLRKASKPAVARRAQLYLDGQDAERFLQVAMMADGGRIVLGSITRRYDNQSPDPSAEARELQMARHLLDVMFLRRGVLKHESAIFTCHAIKLLSKSRLIKKTSGLASVGGPGTVTSEIVDRCFSRMAAWIHLVMLQLEVRNHQVTA